MYFLLIIGLGCVVLYSSLLFTYLRGWTKLPSGNVASILHQPRATVSVVIAARNESENIAACLESLRRQKYNGKLEVILVDDHSTDQTAETALNLQIPNLRVIRPGFDGAQFEGKKSALMTGASFATGEILIFTDADCILPPLWADRLAEAVTDGRNVVTGPVVYRKYKGLFEAFQVLDLLALMVITGGGWKAGLHRLSNGASMAVRREFYLSRDPFRENTHLVSGDDLFLIQEAWRESPGQAGYLKDSEAIAETMPEKGVIRFFHQRLRWASKNKALPESSVNIVWGGVWVTNVITLALLIALLFSWSGTMALATGLILLVKAISEFLVLFSAASFAGLKRALTWFPVAFWLNLIYVPVIGLLALLRTPFSWKSREVRTYS